MKLAIVHELLTMKGGAERVAKIFADMFPEAPIYTLLYNEKKLGDWFPKERVRTSTINPRKGFNHHLYLSRFASAVEAWDFREYDIVLSSSSAFAHGIITNGNPKHICYVHSPARYLWDRTHDVLETANKGILGPLKRRYLERTFHNLRTWDSVAAPRPDVLLAASKEVQRRIELYWRRESDVAYPPIDPFWTKQEIRNNKSESPYFLSVSSLVSYKKIDQAIAAAKATNKKLIVVGEGPDKRKLQSLAGSETEFTGFVDQQKLAELYAGAEALIIPGIEDFGIAPLEAMSCGTPVISLRAGGPQESITEGETGCFFENEKQLEVILQSFNKQNYSADACRKRATEFSEEKFKEQIANAIHL